MIANIIMNVSFISIFIATFFFTYGKTVEKQIVENQVQYIVDDFSQDIDLFFVDEESKKQFGVELKRFIGDNPVEKTPEDIAAEKNNSDLIKKSVLVLGIILVIGLNTAYYMSKKYDFNFWDMFKHNLIILAAAGLTEFVFLTYFAQNYRIADRNKVKYDILESIKNNLN